MNYKKSIANALYYIGKAIPAIIFLVCTYLFFTVYPFRIVVCAGAVCTAIIFIVFFLMEKLCGWVEKHRKIH